MVNGVGNEFLSRSGLTAHEDGRIRMRNLGDLFEQVAHGTAGTDDIWKTVSTPQLVQEVLIFVFQPLAVVVQDLIGPESMAHHRRNQTQTFQLILVIAVRHKRQVDSERAGGLSFYEDGNTDM